VDRRHVALLDAEGVVENVGNRRQAVGRAGRVRDDAVVLGQRVVVDAEDDRLVGIVARCGDDDALGAVGEMRAGLFLRREDAGAFQRDVNVAPGQFLRIADGSDA
jgi:hypothetical protein